MTVGMKEILDELTERIGIRGAIVVDHDGMVVSFSMKEGLEKDHLAALSSSLIQVANKNLLSAGEQDFHRFILTADYGKLVLMDLDFAYLVVVVDKGLDLDRNMIEVFSAARKIQKIGKMKVL